MTNIRINIEMRIESDSESTARQYAIEHGIDVTLANWHRNSNGEGGRLYAVATAPLPAKLPQGGAVEVCGGPVMANQFCLNPVHKISRSDTNNSQWQCHSCGATIRTTWD